MNDLPFYVKLGLEHVLDLSAYDHILFLTALSLPFTFKSWKKVVVLATVFTITHCISLALSSYNLIVMDVGLIEFSIPVTILMTAVLNLLYVKSGKKSSNIWLHALATAFFGLIHGFGFSNYFKMLVAEVEDKAPPLLGFAAGIEISQIIIVLSVLFISQLITSFIKIRHNAFISVFSILIILLTLPMMMETFPFV
ncbi:HupE/UreJ family protein [Pricia sp. S334]|uniref:HupE/UreJ family protein n=1 Tax=Pricia mediterranea TaxID=3076079 RepID=A0ABU3L4Z5_9FLAO|nr:HupE/UreJ family protein [Pricia sp. S334]MDT7828705.1 HupE/UreJ family protein [Pricia sp. S334]